MMAGLAWLMFGLAGNHAGMRRLPDADGSIIEVLSAAGPGLALDQVISAPSSQWRPWGGVDYINAPHGGVVWMRATVRNRGAEPIHGVLADTEYFPDRLEAWTRGNDGGWRAMRSGEAVTGKDKPMWARTAAFPLTVPAAGERVIYLRADDYYFVYVRPSWWPSMEDYLAMQVRDVLAEAICYGGLVALLLYNVVLWARLRFTDIGCYVLYATGAVIFNFVSNGGLALLGLAAGSPWKEMIIAGALSLGGVFLVQFGRIFLSTKDRMPQADQFLRCLLAVLIGLALGVPAMPWMTGLQWLELTVAVLTATHAVMLVVATTAWLRGVRHARFFVAAFGLLFVSALPAVVTWLNHDIAAGAARGLLAGAILEMVMLSFALADRFEQAQRQLVEETEQRRMLEETYSDELELEVGERTRELAQANADKDQMLDVIGHDLRSPLTGLMRSADETTGEFSRETVRTGRALLLMIEDLVLWARLRAGTHAVAMHPAWALMTPAVALHHSLAEYGGVELVLDVPEGLHVETDLVLAQTLVRNLLANALKFARTRVVLCASATGSGGVRFTVGNDGPPLSAAVAARFAAGEDEPMTATGGLGLRFCREICRELGMRLEAGSGADGGTTFSFTIMTTIIDGQSTNRP